MHARSIDPIQPSVRYFARTYLHSATFTLIDIAKDMYLR